MMNHSSGDGRNPTTIDDLDDNMLTQILFRLPSGASVVACSPVNKRWCSIISDPKFGTHFCNHKENTTVSESGPNINEDGEPLWTFISDSASTNETVYRSTIFSMRYLPCTYVIEATFKDLVLCSGPLTSGGNLVFNIANPLTKQLVALPPRPVFYNEGDWKLWVGYLVCQDYKFRVVVIERCPAPVYGLLVYCSEIGEWKKFYLRVPMIKLADDIHHIDRDFEGVVCNGIIYLYHLLYIASFNPFDVDETTNLTTIEAKLLPALPYKVEGYLRESSGKLFVMHHPYYHLSYKKHGRAIELPLNVWKLDPNQVPLMWKMTFEGLFTGNLNKIEDMHSNWSASIWYLGMHPKNDKLICMHLWEEDQLVLCDTQTRLIKPLESVSRYKVKKFFRLDLQWWPTSVPKTNLSNTSE